MNLKLILESYNLNEEDSLNLGLIIGAINPDSEDKMELISISKKNNFDQSHIDYLTDYLSRRSSSDKQIAEGAERELNELLDFEVDQMFQEWEDEFEAEMDDEEWDDDDDGNDDED